MVWIRNTAFYIHITQKSMLKVESDDPFMPEGMAVRVGSLQTIQPSCTMQYNIQIQGGAK
jgi:hypothetical protein